MKTAKEICIEMGQSFNSRSQMLRYFVISNLLSDDPEIDKVPLGRQIKWEEYKKSIGVYSTKSLTKEKLEELINDEYEKYCQNQEIEIEEKNKRGL